MAYQAKHKGSGSYGVVDEAGEWLDDFLGTKEEAQAKANELNSGINSSDGNSNSKDKSKDNSRARARFTLTKQGWLPVGSK